MDNLLRLQDLVNNPTARVPICLCLDTSSSMGRIVGGDFQETGKQVYEDGQMWNIVTGGVSAIDELAEGVKAFYEELLNDEVAQYSAEVCVVTFGGDTPQLVVDFANIDRQPELPPLTAEGETPMGEAVNLALDRLEVRKKEYQEKGVDYYQPWLVLMTDGEPTGDAGELSRAISRTVELVNAKKLVVFPIGIGDEADMDTLARFSPQRTPLHLKGMRFKDFFQWLSQSVSRTSMSMPGENIKLDTDGIKGWGEL